MAGNWKFTPTFLGGGVDVNTGSNAGLLYVELLGAVRAWSRGRELPLGPPRQRAVLAILATRANHTVTRDQLVDGLWGERPPASAANGVHTYVAGLRRVLDPDRHLREAGRVLIGGGSGYLLRLQPDQLDLEIFNGLMASARQSLRAGDLAATVEAFDRAGDFPGAAAVLNDRIQGTHVLDEYRHSFLNCFELYRGRSGSS